VSADLSAISFFATCATYHRLFHPSTRLGIGKGLRYFPVLSSTLLKQTAWNQAILLHQRECRQAKNTISREKRDWKRRDV
jgi:hypothetical protein